MKTRRPFLGRISFAGFPLTHAREQSGAIGLTQSPNLWVGPVMSRGLRRIPPGELPTDLRKRPSTSLAFEFLDQPFRLDLGVEPSPPLVRAESKTLFQINANQARSETTVELQWVHGRLFEAEFRVAAGLQVVSVGPADVVESSHLTSEIKGGDPGAPNPQDRRLRIGLTPLGRGQNKVTIRLTGLQRIAPEGSMKLGLFTPDQTATVNASYALVAERGLALELEDNSGRLRRSGDATFRFQDPSGDWPWTSSSKETSSAPLLLWDDGNSTYLPIRSCACCDRFIMIRRSPLRSRHVGSTWFSGRTWRCAMAHYARWRSVFRRRSRTIGSYWKRIEWHVMSWGRSPAAAGEFGCPSTGRSSIKRRCDSDTVFHWFPASMPSAHGRLRSRGFH